MLTPIGRLPELAARDPKGVRDPTAVLAKQPTPALAAAREQRGVNPAAVIPALPPLMPPANPIQPADLPALQSFARNMQATLEDPKALAGIADDSLTAAFLKLQINDPTDSVAVKNMLSQAFSNLRQMAIDEAKKMLANLAQKIREAIEKLLSMLMMAIMLIAIILMIVAMMMAMIILMIIAIVIMILAAMARQMIEKMIDKLMDQVMEKANAFLDQIDQAMQRAFDDLINKVPKVPELHGPDGQPITMSEARNRLKVPLARARAQVTTIFENEGQAAAAAKGPALVQDAMKRELVGMGLPDALATQAGAAIAAEALTELQKHVQDVVAQAQAKQQALVGGAAQQAAAEQAAAQLAAAQAAAIPQAQLPAAGGRPPLLQLHPVGKQKVAAAPAAAAPAAAAAVDPQTAQLQKLAAAHGLTAAALDGLTDQQKQLVAQMMRQRMA